MDTRRELTHIRKQLDAYHRNVGESVLWAAYNVAESLIDPVYNEPGFRSYFAPVYVQTLWINVTESGKRLDDERIDVRNHLTLAVSAEALRNAGVPDVFSDDVRIFDMIKYWDRYWSIADYEVLGRFPQQDSSTISLVINEIDVDGDYPFEDPQTLLDSTQPVIEPTSTVVPERVFGAGTIAQTWSKVGVISATVGVLPWHVFGTSRIVQVRASVGLAPQGAPIICDVRKNGVSVFTNPANRPTIQPETLTATGVPDVTTLANNDAITVDIVQVGTVTAGSDLTIQVFITPSDG